MRAPNLRAGYANALGIIWSAAEAFTEQVPTLEASHWGFRRLLHTWRYLAREDRKELNLVRFTPIDKVLDKNDNAGRQ